MSFTPPNVASPNKTSALHTTKIVDNNLDRDVSSSTSYSGDSYSDSEESFKVIEINRTSNNNDKKCSNITSTHNSTVVQQSAKNLHVVLENETNVAISNKSRKTQLEIPNKRETEEELDSKAEREDVICAENANKISTQRTNLNKNEQRKQHVGDNKVIATETNLAESLSSYSSYSYSESTSSTLSKPTKEEEEEEEEEEYEEYTESTASPHVKTKVPSQESVLSSYTEEYTQTSSVTPEKENMVSLKNTSNLNAKKETNAIENYTIDDVNRGKNETSVSGSYSSYSNLSASNSTITQKVKREEVKESKEFDVDNAKKGNALQQSRLSPSSSSPITSYYTSQSSLEQKSNKSSLLTATPLVAAEIRLSTSSSSPPSSSSYKYSPSSLTSLPSELLLKQKKLDEPEIELHRSLQELSTATKSESSSSSSLSSSSLKTEKEELEEQEHLQPLQKQYDKKELIVVQVEETQQPITPPLPKRCFVHPLIWHSAEGVYDSKLEDTTSIFLEELLEMQERYESIKMGGRTHETAELSSLQVVHGKPFTSSTKRSSASKLFRLFLPSSSRSKKEESISVKEKAAINMSNNASGSNQGLNQFASERFEHDGRVTFLEPTPPSHFSKRSVNIALSVLGLTRSEKDKLIMEVQPPVTVENFSHLFDACVNTRMKEHVAHTFLSHDTQRKGELPFDETALLLQRCGVAASPWIANVKIDIAAPSQPSLNEISNEYYAHDSNKENVKVNVVPQLVLTIIKKIIPSDNISTNLPQSSQFSQATSVLGKHDVNSINNNNNNDANNNSNMMSNDVFDNTKCNTASETNSNIKQKSQSENVVLQLSSKRNKSSKQRHIVENEETAIVSDNATEFTKYEKREICVCDIVDANMLSGNRTSVYWRDNCIYISDTLICTDIKHEEDYERIKTYVEAATYVCILVKMFTICDLYNNYNATVEYPHVVRTLLLAEMTSTSLQRKLRKLCSIESLHDKSHNVKDQCSLEHAPRNLYIQNVFRNCYYANKQVNKYTQSKYNLQNLRLVSFLEDRLVESSLQETNNSHAKRSRNALPAARVDNLAFYEPSKKQYTPLSVICTSAQVQLPAVENVYFKFALINVRVPLITPESYHCYCLVSAMTNDGVFLPAIKIIVSKVVKSKTFANSETWMFDGVEDENDWNVIYYRGHLLDKIFIECCYERKKLKSSDDLNQSVSKSNKRYKSTNNVNTNSADLSVLNTTNAIGDSTLDQNSRYSSLSTWSKKADTTPESLMHKILVEDHTIWSAGYAVLSLPTLQFSKKGICRKRLNIIADSVSNYEMTESNVRSVAPSSASASASGSNVSFTNNTVSKRSDFNAQNEKSSQQIPVVNIFNQNAESNKNEVNVVDNKKKSTNDIAQARHIDMVIYSRQTQKSETEYEKSKVDFYDLPNRSLLLRRHVLMISKIREAIRYIGLSSRHTRQALNQFNVNQLLNLVSDANLLNQLIKYWKYKMQHMTSKELESKEYKCEQLLLCAGSVSAVHHSTTVPVENIASLLIKKKRLHLSSLLPSTSLTVGTTAATVTNKNCCHHPVNI